jgi:outer membrane murein-binding lipoprotein Lpp
LALTTTACTITATEVAVATTIAVAGGVVASKSYQIYSENQDNAIGQEFLDNENDATSSKYKPKKNRNLKPTPTIPSAENLKHIGRPKGGPPCDPSNSNYLPDPAAEGNHTWH